MAQCPPIFPTCPSNISVSNDAGQCSAVVNYATPAGVDSCSGTTIYNFTTCGVTGRTGPNQTQVNTAYTSTNLNGNVTSLAGIQLWVVPASGLYTIKAVGAAGSGTNGGRGAGMQGDFSLTAGDSLLIVCGQQGDFPNTGNSATGGGGSYVCIVDRNSTDIMSTTTLPVRPMVIAGGGGGNPGVANAACDANITTGGNAGFGTTAFGQGGTNGTGGDIAQNSGNNRGGGGGGFLTDGDRSGTCGTAGAESGASFLNGCVGGNNTTCGSQPHQGGFGGGGGSNSTGWRGSGGGGGYSGGGGGMHNTTSTTHRAGGAGSFNNGSNTADSVGIGTSIGWVRITQQGTPTPTSMVTGLASGSAFPVGVTNVMYVTTNSNGSDTCAFTVTVADTGQVTVLGALSQDTICTSAGTLTLPAGTPAGGNYSGIGVTGNTFDPAVAQLGNHWIYYTDTVGCQNADSVLITVVWCTGIGESDNGGLVKVAPNPSNGIYHLRMSDDVRIRSLEIYDAVGRKLAYDTGSLNGRSLDLTALPDGLYYLKLKANKSEELFRLIKH